MIASMSENMAFTKYDLYKIWPLQNMAFTKYDLYKI
jgi:hypothetical protein